MPSGLDGSLMGFIEYAGLTESMSVQTAWVEVHHADQFGVIYIGILLALVHMHEVILIRSNGLKRDNSAWHARHGL